jgi:uncharacterized protein (TIGR00255 family)
MTGFGAGESALGDGRVAVELRGLNHRFLEVRVRLPTELADQSSFLEQLARERLGRGRFDVGVRLLGSPLPPPRFSASRARSLYQALSALRDELSPGTPLPISSVVGLPELLLEAESADSEAVRAALTSAFTTALERLDTMRAREGEALSRELSARLEIARSLTARVRERSEHAVAAQRGRLEERLSHLLGNSVELDPTRLEAEVAILADRADVSEELARLTSHFDQFEQLLGQKGPIGRQLDFLLQEIAREANTAGAKSQDATIAHLVVQAKVEIERLREQVQNVE